MLKEFSINSIKEEVMNCFIHVTEHTQLAAFQFIIAR